MSNIKNKFQGFVAWKVLKSETGEVVTDIGERYPQLVTDVGLDILDITSMTSATSICRVGSDATAPATTDTDLGTRVGNPSGTATYTGLDSSVGAPYWHSYTGDYTFNTSTGISGVALAELGFFQNTGSGVMFSRVLFKDGGGTPITITLLADEILIVTYEVRRYVPDSTTPVAGTFDVDYGAGPVTHNYQLTPLGVTNHTRWGPQARQDPTGSVKALENDVLASPTDSSAPIGGLDEYFVTSAIKNTYIPGSYSNSVSVIADITQANFPTGIGGLEFSAEGFPVFHVTFSPKLTKTAVDSLDFQNFFTWSWDRGVLP